MTPAIFLWKNQESNSQSKNPPRNVWIHSLPLSYILGNTKCDFWAWRSACIFISPCFSCEPKVKVVTFRKFIIIFHRFVWKWTTNCCIFKVYLLVLGTNMGRKELALQLPNAKDKDKQKTLEDDEMNIPSSISWNPTFGEGFRIRVWPLLIMQL